MESMEDYKDLYEASFKKFRIGDIVRGTVISVDENGAVVDLNYYAPGFIAVDEFSDNPDFSIEEEIKVGDEVTAAVVSTDDGAGNIVLSKKEASHETAWEKFREWKAEGKRVSVKIAEAVNAGVVCYLEGIRAFIPASKLALHYVENPEEYVGQTVDAVVITVDEKNGKLVLSCREILQEKLDEQRNEQVNRLSVGSIVNGKVESLKDYGAFVDIGDGVSGLVHISQIPYPKKLVHPKYALNEGQEVTVKITRIENGKVSLSMKDINEAIDKEVDEEPVEYVSNVTAGTSMADLFKKLGF